VGVKKNVVVQNIENLKILEFIIAGRHFGINVAKVGSLIKYSQYPITPMANSNPYVEGIFSPRNDTMTVIDLASYMGLPPSEDDEHDILIITKLNNAQTAFHVHGVNSIAAVPMADIEKPDPTIYGGQDSMATAVAKFDGRLITIIDFEKVMLDISPDKHYLFDDSGISTDTNRSTRPLMVVEDSPLLEKLIIQSLEKAGYVNVTCLNNGKEAWSLLQDYKEAGDGVGNHVRAIITDIEMPLMDGHSLLRKIKADKELNHLPVIIFSSLISDDMRELGDKYGAAANISKPEITTLVNVLDNFIV